MSPSDRRVSAYSQRHLSSASYNRSGPRRRHTTQSRALQANRAAARPKFRVLLVLAVLLTFGGHGVWSKHVSAQNLAAQQAQQAAMAAAKRKTDIFSSQVAALIAAHPQIDISVAAAGSDSAVQTFGSTDTFDGASTAKLLTAADYLRHVERGDARLSQRIQGQTAQHWLKIMLVDSDDTAWSVLNAYLGHDDLAAYASSIGFRRYNPEDNTFTASDLARLLQKLYGNDLLNSANRSLMLGYMAQANYRQYVVAAVPDGDGAYHKIGIDEDTVNDAAIITEGQKYLVLVIFTNGHGSYDWDNRAQLMQAITKDAAAAYL